VAALGLLGQALAGLGVTLVAEVRRRLAAAADPAKAPAMQAYMRSAMPFRGVTAVPLRTLLREVLAADPLESVEAWRAAVLELWDGAEFREERYAAIALTGHRHYRAFQTPDQLDLYRHLVETGAWWDYVDDVAKNRIGPILRAEPDEALLRWVLVQNLEGSLHGRELFVRKAVGWALREHARTAPEWVRAFVAEHADEMSGLTGREALKHLQ